MIKVYPVKVEAVNELKQLVFKLEKFGEGSARIEIATLVSKDNLNELFAAIYEGVELLELE